MQDFTEMNALEMFSFLNLLSQTKQHDNLHIKQLEWFHVAGYLVNLRIVVFPVLIKVYRIRLPLIYRSKLI